MNKSAMTNRDRILRTLQCLPVDRAPFGVGVGFIPWKTTLARWREESGIGELDVSEYFGYDKGFLVVPAEYGPYPHFPEEILFEDDEYITSTEYRGMTLRSRIDGGSMPEFLGNPVKNPEDWKRYKEERLQPGFSERLSGLDDFIDMVSETDAPVQAGDYPWGVFGTARDMLGTEELLIGFYTEPELIREIMESCTDLWLHLYSAIASKMRIDHIHIWEDMSGKNGSLISMKMVEEFMMPCYDRIGRFAKERKIPLISVDSDGQVNELVPVMMKHGVNVFFPFEVQAGNDVIEYRRKYPTIGIIGGLDKNALADNAPREAMHRELDKTEKMLALGGYIPGFDHLIPPNVSWSTWNYFMKTLRKLIGA
jgi:uroporphyrinogen-III decarboxylase